MPTRDLPRRSASRIMSTSCWISFRVQSGSLSKEKLSHRLSTEVVKSRPRFQNQCFLIYPDEDTAKFSIREVKDLRNRSASPRIARLILESDTFVWDSGLMCMLVLDRGYILEVILYTNFVREESGDAA